MIWNKLLNALCQTVSSALLTTEHNAQMESLAQADTTEIFANSSKQSQCSGTEFDSPGKLEWLTNWNTFLAIMQWTYCISLRLFGNYTDLTFLWGIVDLDVRWCECWICPVKTGNQFDTCYLCCCYKSMLPKHIGFIFKEAAKIGSRWSFLLSSQLEALDIFF